MIVSIFDAANVGKMMIPIADFYQVLHYIFKDEMQYIRISMT